LRQRTLHKRAADLVVTLFTARIRRADVIEALHKDAQLDDTLRQTALALAEQYHMSPRNLSDTSRRAVGQPGAAAETYRRALLQAEEACGLEPQSATHLAIVGMAQYRLGQYAAAVETLARAQKLPQAKALEQSVPEAVGFLAMAQYQVGQKEQARATCARFREALARLRPGFPGINVDLLREAETLIEGAERLPDDLRRYNSASWAIVSQAGASADKIAQALQWAETASRQQPENGNVLNTLGVAQYRAHKFPEALQTLQRSEELNRSRLKSSSPADLAFLAMTCYRLGKKDQAQEYLDQLRKAMAEPRWKNNEEGKRFLSEAEALLKEPGPENP
jgi:tetratricopeptide (TPR) repeat protein